MHQTFDDPNSEKARQCLLDRRCAKMPKRHRVKGRRKRMSAAKKRRVTHANNIKVAAYRRLKRRISAYWSGAADAHP